MLGYILKIIVSIQLNEIIEIYAIVSAIAIIINDLNNSVFMSYYFEIQIINSGYNYIS